MTKAVYAGSFDPITKGHEWVMREAARLFPDLTVAIAVNPGKKYTFTLEERQALIRESLGPLEGARTSMAGFDVSVVGDEPRVDWANRHGWNISKGIKLAVIGNEFLVDWANDHGCTHLVRGIRNQTDFEMEQAMRNINRDRMPSIETVFLLPPRELCETSSSMLKSLVGVNGWETLARNYAPQHVIDALAAKIPRTG